MPERDTNCAKPQCTDDTKPPKTENVDELALKDMHISSQSKGAENHQYQFTEYQRTVHPQPQQRYRTTTNPDQRSVSSLHSNSASSRPYYGGPIEPAFTSLNPPYAYNGAPMPAYPSQHHIYQAPSHACHSYPANMTSTQFDRIAAGVNNPYSSCHPAYEPVYSHHPLRSGLPQQLPHQPDVSDPFIRRVDEIERLKMRIMMLEQSDPEASSSTAHSHEMQKLKKLEYETSLLRSEMGSNMSREDTIARLEQSLNQKEYEILENQKAYNQELDQLNKDLLKVKDQLSEKDQEAQKEKTKSLAMQRDLDKLQSKLGERDDYIGQLPTIDEVAASKQKFEDQNAEMDGLRAKIKELETKVVRAKGFIRENNREIKQAQDRCESLQLEKERVEKEFELYKEATQNVGELMSRCEENASIRAEFELAKKMILKCEEKNKNQQVKFEAHIAELKEAQRLEQDVGDGLRKELVEKEKSLKKLSDSVKEISRENQSLLSTNLTLQDQCRSFELMLSADTTKLLHLLFIELSACTSDLDSLVNNVIDIYNGKQVDITSLLGCSGEYTNNADLACNITQATGLINNEFISTRTNEIKSFRERIASVRKMVSDEYAEKLGANMSCATQ